jgi:hypothetical protein
MRFTTKKLVALLLLTLLPAFSISQIVNAQVPSFLAPLTEQQKVLQDKTLAFLKNVVELNLSRYSTTQVTASPSSHGIFFKFQSSEGKLDVTSEFIDGELVWCKLYPIKDCPVYTTSSPSSDVINTAKGTLDRINTFSTKEYLPIMRSLLSTVTELKNSKITIGDFTQEIEVRENTVKMYWEPFANGLSSARNKLFLEFENGNLVQYGNYLDIYKIGSSEVKISEEQAIQIAKNYARTFSYKQYGETVSNFTVLDSIAIAKINLDDRGNNTLYPLWNIQLPLDKMYPGGVTAFRVLMWADTGEISYFSPIGFYGGTNAVPSPGPQQTSSPTTQAALVKNQPTVSNSLIIVLAIAVTAAITMSYLIYKRKR